MNVFFELILAYLIYRFIAGLLVPVYRTTRNMRQQFQDMNGRSSTPGSGPIPNQPHPGAKPSAKQPETPKNGAASMGEYIDFEEVK